MIFSRRRIFFQNIYLSLRSYLLERRRPRRKNNEIMAGKKIITRTTNVIMPLNAVFWRLARVDSLVSRLDDHNEEDCQQEGSPTDEGIAPENPRRSAASFSLHALLERALSSMRATLCHTQKLHTQQIAATPHFSTTRDTTRRKNKQRSGRCATSNLPGPARH